MFQHPILVHFHDEQEFARVADGDAVGVGQITDHDIDFTRCRVVRKNAAVSAVLHDVEQRCVERVAVLLCPELTARLTEVDGTVFRHGEVVGEYICILATVKECDVTIHVNALQACECIRDNQGTITGSLNAERTAPNKGEVFGAPVTDANDMAAEGGRVYKTILPQGRVLGTFKRVEFNACCCFKQFVGREWVDKTAIGRCLPGNGIDRHWPEQQVGNCASQEYSDESQDALHALCLAFCLDHL